jgi:gluconate 2-dehydrogenase gamma chain
MKNDDLSRRDFIARSGGAASGMWLTRALPFLAATQACATEAALVEADFVTFTDREAADFDAFAGRIVPTDDTPGAREAGVTRFADQALDTFFADLLPIIRSGLEGIDARIPGAEGFEDVTEGEQDDVIRAVEQEDPGFFFFARTLVMLGMVADAKYGGNQNEVGWDLIGFEGDFGYQPPFGYYDRDEHDGAAAIGDEQ